MVPLRLLPAVCTSCGAELTLIVNHESDTLMMQVWMCVVCKAANDAVFTRSIRQVTRRIDRRPSPPSLDL